MPVRLGVPHSVKGLADVVRNPIYSTGVGLLLYGLHKQADGVPRPTRQLCRRIKASVLDRLKGWIRAILSSAL